MRKYAADNLMFLREHYPEIYKYIRDQQPDTGKFRIAEARNGEPILAYTSDDGSQQWLNSRYNPTLEAQRWAETLGVEVANNNDALLCGFGLGYHAAAFLETYPDKRLYLYEPHVDVFLHAVENRDLRPILSNKRIAMFAVGEDNQTQIQLLEESLNHITGALASLVIPVYRQVFPEFVRDYSETVIYSAKAMSVSLNTIDRFRDDWIRNMILNMRCNLESHSFLGMRGVCKDIPAIIVGSGPSLEMEIDSIRKLRNTALIIAAGSSVQALQKHNINPHLAVTIDPGYLNNRVYNQIDLENIPLLYIPSAHFAILEKPLRYRMHAFFLLDTPVNYLMKVTSADPVFRNTGTVSGTAIQAAMYMGCKEFYFIGQDYSFPGDQYYSSGVVHVTDNTLARLVNNATETVQNVQGGFNRTNSSMNVLRQGIEQFLDLYPNYTFYNASKIGAVIAHTKLKTLDELLEERADFVMSEDWFERKLNDNLTPYPSNRIDAIHERLGLLYRKVKEFEEGFETIQTMFENIADKMADYSDEYMLNWLISFQQVWSDIVDDETFKHVFGFFLLRELNYLDRHWPDMMEIQDHRKKASRIIELMSPLMESWTKVLERMQESLNELDSKMGHRFSEASV